MKFNQVTPKDVLTLKSANVVEYEGTAGFSFYIPNAAEGWQTLKKLWTIYFWKKTGRDSGIFWKERSSGSDSSFMLRRSVSSNSHGLIARHT